MKKTKKFSIYTNLKIHLISNNRQLFHYFLNLSSFSNFLFLYILLFMASLVDVYEHVTI